MADALDDIAVRQAVQGINVDEQGQTLEIQGIQGASLPLALTSYDTRFFVNFLRRHPRAVGKLFIERCSFALEALEILRAYFTNRAMSLNHIRFDGVDLGNANSRRLFSGLHGNNSVTRLDFWSVGLEGQAGGTVLSDVLQHNPRLTTLYCYDLRLGVEGARALQPGLRANQTMQFLGLESCKLGNEGLSLIVDALQGNTTITRLYITSNRITSNALPLVTQLLQHPSLRTIALGSNPRLFDHQDNVGQFLLALQNSQVITVYLNFCQLPGHAMAALFQAVALNLTITYLEVYDDRQLHGADLECLLELIPLMRNVRELRINLDFMDESVLSAFHGNTSIQHLFTWNVTDWQEVTSGPVFEIMKRNRWLYYAIKLLDSEHRRTIPLGLWSKAIELLARDNTGATSAYKILMEKPVLWWAPHQAASTVSDPVASTAVAAAAAPATSSFNSTVKRPHTASIGHDDDGEMDAKSTGSAISSFTSMVKGGSHAQACMGHNVGETPTKSMSSSSSTEPQRKRHLSLPKSTGKELPTTSIAMMMDDIDMASIDSLSREELMEMIQQQQKKIAEQDVKILAQADTIAKIAMLVNKKSTDGAETEEEEDQKMTSTTKKGENTWHQS